MRRNGRILRFAAALLCICMVISSVAVAETSVPAINTSNSSGLSYDPSVPVNPVELLTGNSPLGKDDQGNFLSLAETIQNYRNTYLLGVAADFCVFLNDFFWVIESDAEGRVAVGGNIYTDISQYPKYTIGAGDYHWRTPLDELLLDDTGAQNRVGAATVIMGGFLYGQLTDTYYSFPKSSALTSSDRLRRKSEDEDKYFTNRAKSTKRIVLQWNMPSSDADEKLDTWVPQVIFPGGGTESYWGNIYGGEMNPDNWTYWHNLYGDRSKDLPSTDGPGQWQVLDRRQTYVTQLFVFNDSFTYLKSISTELTKAQNDFTIEYATDHITEAGTRAANGGGLTTIIFTYVGDSDDDGVLRDCVYLNLTPAEFQAFTDASYIEFRNIPTLETPRKVVDIRDSGSTPMDDAHLVDWPYTYIVVNFTGKGQDGISTVSGLSAFSLADLHNANGQKFTSINGQYISRTGPTDNGSAALAKNNHPGVTSILYNFPEAEAVIIGNNFQGTILAPNAYVTDWFTENGWTEQDNIPDGYGDTARNLRGHLSGALIADSFKGATEFGYRPFSGPFSIITGELKISKTVVSPSAADSDKPFTFKVTLSDTSINGTYGDLTFTGGIATVVLKHNESALATGLRSGIGYTVEEISGMDGFRVATGVIGQTKVTGSIVLDDTSAVVFTNTRILGDLTVTKSVTGEGADLTKKFDFIVTLGDKSISGPFGDMTFANGVARFSLASGGVMTATGLPAGITYTVQEANYADYIPASGSLTSTGTIPENSAATVAFVNQKVEDDREDDTGTLTVTKSVTGTGADLTLGFRFTVTLSDRTVSGTYGTMTFINGVASFTLKHGESKTATGLPTGVRYTVAEEAAKDYVVTKTGDTGAIQANQTASALFVNAYIADVTAPQTGDSFPLYLWLGLMAISLMGLGLLATRKFRRN